MTGVFAVFVGAVIVVLAVFKTIGVGSGVVFPDWLCHILWLCGIWAFLGLGGAMFLYPLRYFILLREKQMGEAFESAFKTLFVLLFVALGAHYHNVNGVIQSYTNWVMFRDYRIGKMDGWK